MVISTEQNANQKTLYFCNEDAERLSNEILRVAKEANDHKARRVITILNQKGGLEAEIWIQPKKEGGDGEN
jgi:hypothetical protein